MTRRFLFLVALALFLSVAPTASADPMIDTGGALRVKSIGFVNYKLYWIEHYMASKPANKSKRDVIDADVSKQFTWTMKNDLPAEKVKKALREAFQMNSYNDAGKINQFLAAFSGEELKEKSTLTILYDANSKSTTVTVPGGGKATVPGIDFMKGVWSIWFGNIDQNNLGDQLISKL